MMRGGLRAVMCVLAVSGAVTACGGGQKPPPPIAVDAALAPEAVAPGNLKLFENTDTSTRKAFADAGQTALFADGRLWEIRRADRLVGTLQISTVVDKVDLRKSKTRNDIVAQILTAPIRIRVHDVEVSATAAEDHGSYVWFGRHIVEILTLKGVKDAKLDDVLAAIIAHEQTVKSWVPLPIQVERDTSTRN